MADENKPVSPWSVAWLQQLGATIVVAGTLLGFLGTLLLDRYTAGLRADIAELKQTRDVLMKTLERMDERLYRILERQNERQR
jgi:hypothetical protein